MKRQISIWVILFGSLIELISGCTAPLPIEKTTHIPKVAVIKAGHTGLSAFVTTSSIFITAIDGKEILSSAEEILPGTHRLEVSWRQQSRHDKTVWSASTEITFVAQAGHQYVVKGIPDVDNNTSSTPRFTVIFWIEDEQSGVVVGGKKPKHAK